MLCALVGALGLCACISIAHAGDYYKWKDAHGTVHYSQTPPPDRSTTTMHVSDPAAAALPLGSSKGQQTPVQKAQAKTAQSALLKTDAKAANRNCASARDNVGRLQTSKMIVNSDNPDTARALDPKQRKQALNKARDQAAYYCAPQSSSPTKP